MSDQPVVNTEKYEGPGKLTGAIGDAKIYGFVGSVAGLGLGAGAGALIKQDSKLAESFSKRFLATSSKTLQSIPHKDFKTTVILGGAALGSTVLAVGGALWGVVRGWRNGNKGEMQFNAIKEQRDQAVQKLETLQAQIGGLNHEVESQRKFTDTIRPRTEQSEVSNSLGR